MKWRARERKVERRVKCANLVMRNADRGKESLRKSEYSLSLKQGRRKSFMTPPASPCPPGKRP